VPDCPQRLLAINRLSGNTCIRIVLAMHLDTSSTLSLATELASATWNWAARTPTDIGGPPNFEVEATSSYRWDYHRGADHFSVGLADGRPETVQLPVFSSNVSLEGLTTEDAVRLRDQANADLLAAYRATLEALSELPGAPLGEWGPDDNGAPTGFGGCQSAAWSVPAGTFVLYVTEVGEPDMDFVALTLLPPG